MELEGRGGEEKRGDAIPKFLSIAINTTEEGKTLSTSTEEQKGPGSRDRSRGTKR